MDPVERSNLIEIESLNQRGGRTLSLVDLIRAGTMTVEMVGYLWTAVAHGASFLTAARPGGAGKSTVLANLLGLLPLGERIVTVTDRAAVAAGQRVCYLAHEIGAGPWYGYIWGPRVARFLALVGQGHRIASCLHADTLEELREVLLEPPLAVPEQDLNQVGLVLFIHVVGGYQRRVVAVYEATGSGHQMVFRWDPRQDRIERCGPLELPRRLGAGSGELVARVEAVREIVAEGRERFEQVRERVVHRYELA